MSQFKNDEWIKEFRKMRHNSVYFVENVWNKLHPDKAVELTDEEKQYYFDYFKAIPVLNNDAEWDAWHRRVAEAKEKGLKDWEWMGM